MDNNSCEGLEPCGHHEIEAACAHLRAAEKLLLNPTPSAMENAGFVLQKAFVSAQSWQNVDNSALDSLTELLNLCRRVKALLEGALRVQWAYIHRISSATQTYSPTQELKTWIPRVSSLSIHA